MKRVTYFILAFLILLSACQANPGTPTPPTSGVSSTLEGTQLPTLVQPTLEATRLPELSWVNVPLTGYPAPWWSTPAVYDPDRRVVVLFGGRTPENLPLDQTWEFDGTSWRKVETVHHPPARIWHAMTYDSTRKVMVLFGGDSSTSIPKSWLNDTWEYDGLDWEQVQTERSPAPRGDGPAMVYDSCRQRTVLFGGNGSDAETTWEYDGQAWTEIDLPALSLKPSARWLTSMVFDPLRCRAILFGGGSGPDGLNDTWEYDGLSWTMIAPTDRPPSRWSHALVFDPVSGSVFLFGGYVPGLSRGSNDIWSYAGQAWSQVSVRVPPPEKDEPVMVYDAGLGSLVLLDSNALWSLKLHPPLALLPSQEPTSTSQAAQRTSAISPTPSCAVGWTRLEITGYAIVTPGDLPNRVRKDPSLDPNNILSTLYPGEIVKVVEGPICADDLVFWKVENGDIPGGIGWTAEGDGKVYYLEPYEP